MSAAPRTQCRSQLPLAHRTGASLANDPAVVSSALAECSRPEPFRRMLRRIGRRPGELAGIHRNDGAGIDEGLFHQALLATGGDAVIDCCSLGLALRLGTHHKAKHCASTSGYCPPTIPRVGALCVPDAVCWKVDRVVFNGTCLLGVRRSDLPEKHRQKSTPYCNLHWTSSNWANATAHDAREGFDAASARDPAFRLPHLAINLSPELSRMIVSS